jgi:hypothetical protein
MEFLTYSKNNTKVNPRNNKFVLFVITIILFSINGLQAQTKKSGEVGLFAGGSFYLGELNKVPFAESKLAFGAFYRHTFDSRFSARGNFNYGHLAGDSTHADIAYQNNRSFNNPFYELNGQLEFNFKPYTPTNKKTKFTPYVFAGAGFMYYPKGTKTFIFNIPFGVGVKYNVYGNFICGADFGMRKTFTDAIDYPYNNPPSINNPEKQMGYTGTKDWYSVFGVYLSYKIKYRQKCPAFD